ncbi:Guanylate-binding protein 1 [Bienertia sinuspersici]
MSGINCVSLTPLDNSSKNLPTTSLSSNNHVSVATPVLQFDLNEPALDEEEDGHLIDLNYPPSYAIEEEWGALHLSQNPVEDEELVMEWLENDSDVDVEEYEWTDDESDEDNPIPEIHEQALEASHEEEHQPSHGESGQTSKKRRVELSNFNRTHVADKLQQACNGYKLPQGEIKKIAEEFMVSRWTVSRIWKLVQSQMIADEHINVANKRTGKVGRKRIQFNPEELKLISLRTRTSVRAVAAALGIHRSTLHRLIKRGAIKKHSNALKPDLSSEHRQARVIWCLKSVIPGTINTLPRFSHMYNVVHIDEKWFCMSKVTQKYYLAPDEKEPQRKCKSKRFIIKVMFIAGLARPIIDNNGEVLFDGKVGIFPFTEVVPAKRTSKNRVAGTMETKLIRSVTKEVVKDKIVHDMLPSIRDKWPSWGTKDIFIVQDNAKPHISGREPEFVEEATKDGFNIRMVNQPAQSPDMNVLDLGYFRAVQSIKDQIAPKTVEELIELL